MVLSLRLVRLQAFLLIVLLQGTFHFNAVLAQPTVSITSPSNGAILHGTFTVMVSASSPDHIAFVEAFYQQGVVQGEIGITATTPYSFDWDTTKLDNGTYQLYAKAVDNNGQNATSSSITVTVQNGAAGAPTLSPSSLGLLAVILVLIAVSVMIIYRGRSRRSLKLPSTSTVQFVAR